ncbi:MAG: hypothetical protein ABW078_08930 [Sedimenticola sp.]
MRISEVENIFFSESAPKELRMSITVDNAWEIKKSASNFKNQMIQAVRDFSDLLQVSTDEEEGAPSPRLISDCCWGLSGLAELISALESIESEAGRVQFSVASTMWLEDQTEKLTQSGT